MVEKKLNIDTYSRSIVTERDICERLYSNKQLDYHAVELKSVERYNKAVDDLYLTWPKLKQLEEITVDPDTWHEHNQNIWFMPEEYQKLDIAKWLLDQCKNETELQRTGAELLLYAERDMLDLLRYLKYFVDTLRDNNIVWGVGRGSSVASFVLYLIGVHKINSIAYNLDIAEFIR
jgi:DNA polymerase III alpha subunit